MSDNINYIAEYRKLLEDSGKSKAQEYKQIAEILHEYRFKDQGIQK